MNQPLFSQFFKFISYLVLFILFSCHYLLKLLVHSVSLFFECFSIIVKHFFKLFQVILEKFNCAGQRLYLIGQFFVLECEISNMRFFVRKFLFFLTYFLLKSKYLIFELIILLYQRLYHGNLLFKSSFSVFSFLHLSLINNDSFPTPSNFLNSLINSLIELVGIVDNFLHLLPQVSKLVSKSIIILHQFLDLSIFGVVLSLKPLHLSKNIIDVLLYVIIHSSLLLYCVLCIV